MRTWGILLVLGLVLAFLPAVVLADDRAAPAPGADVVLGPSEDKPEKEPKVFPQEEPGKDPEAAPEAAPEEEPELPPVDFVMQGNGPLEGVWVTGNPYEGGEVRLDIASVGLVTKTVRLSEAEMQLWQGHGSYEDGVFRVWVVGRKPPVQAYRCKLEGDVLEMTDEEGETLRYTRETSRDAEPPAPTLDRELVLPGSWVAAEPTLQYAYEFGHDGRFTATILVEESGDEILSHGTYSFQGSRIVLQFVRPDGQQGDASESEFRVADPDTVELVDSKGLVLRLFRRDGDHAPGGPAELAGIWAGNLGDSKLVLTLRRDGTMVHQETSDGETHRRMGRYKVTDDTFRMRLNQVEELRFRLHLPDRDTWKMDEDGDLTFRRIGEADDAETGRTDKRSPLDGPNVDAPTQDGPSSATPSVQGTWEARDEGIHIEVTLNGDGTFTNVVTSGGEAETVRGRYEVSGGVLTARPEGEEALRFQIKALESDRLVLVEESGEVTVLTRKGAPKRGFFGPRTGEPATGGGAGKMVGEWLMKTAELELRITLRADGTFTEATKTGQGTDTTQGRYQIRGNALTVYPDGVEGGMELKVRLVDDDTLEILDEDGNGAQLKRQR